MSEGSKTEEVFECMQRSEVSECKSTATESSLSKPESGKHAEMLESGVRIFANLAIAIAALVGVWQYIEVNRELKRERSLEYVRTWENGSWIEQYAELQNFLEDRIIEAGPLASQVASLPPEAQRVALRNFGERLSTKLHNGEFEGSDNVENTIHRITLYFGQIGICVSASLCDKQVIQAYLGDEIVSFWTYFEGYAIFRRNNNYANYGYAVNDLVALLSKK